MNARERGHLRQRVQTPVSTGTIRNMSNTLRRPYYVRGTDPTNNEQIAFECAAWRLQGEGRRVGEWAAIGTLSLLKTAETDDPNPMKPDLDIGALSMFPSNRIGRHSYPSRRHRRFSPLRPLNHQMRPKRGRSAIGATIHPPYIGPAPARPNSNAPARACRSPRTLWHNAIGYRRSVASRSLERRTLL